ncbi:ExeM/NucH family extracellular endonuclease, partial [Microbacterium rhizophilus]|uniref:ExeM/NucH family extracellular endonuclease n=1 Tax=Microbacterium rhizophilus TaxID=3138934 RepID=UPI0031EE8AB0
MSLFGPAPARRRVAAIASAALTAGCLASFVPTAAFAAPDGSKVVINEVYGGGGNGGATYKNDFVELYNPTDADVSLAGWSLYASSATSATALYNSGRLALTGTIPAGGHYLVQAAAGTGGTTDLPAPDQTVDWAMGAGGFKVLLTGPGAATRTGIPSGDFVGAAIDGYVDGVGVGNANGFEAAVGATPSAAVSAHRTDGADSDSNAADFATAAPSPESSGLTPDPEPTEPSPTPTETAPATVTPVRDVQGTGDTSPVNGRTVTVEGVVTADYRSGGFNGFYLQDPAGDPADGKSDGIFVYGANARAEIGQSVRVTGPVSEYNGTTEITPAAGGVAVLPESLGTVTPVSVANWAALDTAAEKEAHEGELVLPTESFTVSDNYDANYYASFLLAAGEGELKTPTEEADAADTAGIAAIVAENAARSITIDDGQSTNFNSSANKAVPLPYLTPENPVRIGSTAQFQAAGILEYRNSLWNLQPTTPITGDGSGFVAFSDERTPNLAPQDVGGDIRLATFNVLNYFATTAEEYVASGGSCSTYADRAGDPVTANDCGPTGPRGAAEAEDLERQEIKIVKAINALDASIVSLEEIENSAHFGKERDFAVATLVDALNENAGSDVWEFVPSPATRPDVADEDVIRTAFIYKPANVAPVGESRILIDETHFGNAREPLFQAFKAAGGADEDAFLVSVNHFKSKGSGTDDGTGQGNANQDRIGQAQALLDFTAQLETETGIDAVFFTGDFNAYSSEDPVQLIEDAGYTEVNREFNDGEATYSFDGMAGSLDHVFANDAALELVTDVDVWQINAQEQVGFEYSRHNYNATILYDESVFRASDHNPEIVGLDLPDVAAPIDLDLVNINDFHGRIDGNTLDFARTVEDLKAQNPEGTTFVSAGDNIGASLFASATQKDTPTLDVLDALGLQTSAVGNHEFDQGFADLTDRVSQEADFSYLGANVYEKGTETPALEEYDVVTVDGVDIGFVGVVTQETPSLVAGAGVSTIDFGDPVDALNRVTAQLLDDDESNGEADLVVALVHDGAGAGTPDGATIEQEIAAGGPFAEIVTETDPRVAAILTGHTHKQYAWDAPITGTDDTRPIIQTGNYGEFLGHISLSVDPETFDVLDYDVENVKRIAPPVAPTPPAANATEEQKAKYAADKALYDVAKAEYDADLAADLEANPVLAEVKAIVDAALDYAAEVGNEPVASVTKDITSAFANGSFIDGVWTGGTRDDRGSESALGNLVADSLVGALSAPERGGAEIGVVNPGGLRNELYYKGSSVGEGDGVVTYAEANAVLPFVNNLWTTTLTGAQLDDLLEQQWQTTTEGGATRPSRPYLALGLSSNVTWVADTANPNATPGDHVDAIYIDGELVQPTDEIRVGTFSFLAAPAATAGDNFFAFQHGTNPTDSGLVDRDAWIDYLADNAPLSPSFARTRAVASEVGTVAAGEEARIALSGLNLTSLGAPQNTTAEVRLGDEVLGSLPVAADGSVDGTVTIPADTAVGDHSLEVVVAPSGTIVRLAFTAEAAAPQELEVGRPSVSGTVKVTQTVTAKPGTWTA